MSAFPYTVVDPIETPGRLDLDKAHDDDAGFDLRAATSTRLRAGDSVTVPTGIRIALPHGFCGLVLPRSGLASKHGLTIPNAPGLIDAGYRGEIKVPLYLSPTYDDIYKIANRISPRVFGIEEGDRVAQLVVVEVAATDALFYPPERFQPMWGETDRGEKGFGSSGR